MDAVKEKMEKLANHVRENGYPKKHGENNFSYRLDDEYFTYDLFDENNDNISVLVMGIERSDGMKIPLWKALYKDREFERFLPKIRIWRKR